MQCELRGRQHPSMDHKQYILIGNTGAHELPHCGKIQEGTRIDNGSLWYLSWQSVQVAVDYGFNWDPGGHMSNEVNDPLQLVVMQLLVHAILCQSQWGVHRHALRRRCLVESIVTVRRGMRPTLQKIMAHICACVQCLFSWEESLTVNRAGLWIACYCTRKLPRFYWSLRLTCGCSSLSMACAYPHGQVRRAS